MKVLKQFKNMRKTYGFIFALKATFIRVFSQEKYNRYMFMKLDKEYGDLAEEITKSNRFTLKNIIERIPIWVFWWQGLDKSPELIKKCISSIYTNFNKEKYQITLITQENIKEICCFPDYIYNKMEKGKISLTHFSDLIRADLLYRNGGLWIDATVFVTKEVPFDYFDKYDFFTLISKKSDRIINGRWTGFFMYCKKEYPLWKFMYQAFLDYWKIHDDLVAYLLIDFLIAVYDKHSSDFRKDLSKVDYSNFNLWEYLRKMNQPFDKEKWDRDCLDTYFYKLSYKNEINGGELKTEIDGELSNWGNICKY